MEQFDVLVIGGGPCGLSAAIEIEKEGFDVVTIERGNVVNSIYHYPTHQTFFSSSLKLSIGDIPFITAKEKPKRNDALVYYRNVVQMKGLNVRTYEEVVDVQRNKNGRFTVITSKQTYDVRYVVLATGYYDNPNQLEAKGADLPHVHHYFKEAHPYFGEDVVIIGGKNSAIDAAIELTRAGANVTVVYRGSSYSPSIKPWVLPGFESLVRHQEASIYFDSEVKEITEDKVIIEQQGKEIELSASTVFAMIGYHPDFHFFNRLGIDVNEETGCPLFDQETMESSIPGIYVAGVIAAGNDANTIFIENGKFHGCQIASALAQQFDE